MFKKLVETLTVQKADLPWVRPTLDTLIRGIIATVVVLIVITIGWLVVRQWEWWMPIGFVWLPVVLGLKRLNQKEHTSTVIHLLLATITLYATIAEPLGFSVPGLNQAAYAMPIVIAALLINPAASLVWAAITTLANLARLLTVAHGAVDYTGLLMSTAGLNTVTLIMWPLGRTFQQHRGDLRRQIQQGQAGIEIGHAVTSALDPASIIRQTVQLIYNAFRYYHVGLFVVSPEGDLAVLVEAAGEAAENLKERGFHTSLTSTTVVATAINQKRRRQVVSWEESLDHRGRTVHFTHDRLPTRAELVIPLVVRDRVLGALDIHSTELDPFPEEDIHTLEGLIGNVANALDAARLLDDVQQRHQELSEIYAQTERRSRYLETTAELARAISALLDPEELLPKAAELVSSGLDIYHVGIFLVDETEEWAVLTATNSPGGWQMMARGHKLRVGAQGIVGWVTQAGQPRIALDVGEDAVFFDNPDLPETRSEIALPLKIGERVIGALDVQSKREAAFSEEDVAVLQVLADQVAVAIENARLFQETQRALEDVQALQRYYVAQEWERISRQRPDLGAEYRSLGTPSLETAWTPEMEMAITQETPVVLPDLVAADLGEDGGDGKGVEGDSGSLPARAALAVPIKLRGEVIGVLDLQEVGEPRDWTEEEVSIATSVADQLALALENARLFEEAQSRAQELEGINEVGRAVTSVLDQEAVIRQVVDITKVRLGYFFVSIALIEEGELILRDSSTIGDSDVRLESGSVIIDLQQRDSLVAEAARTGEPMLVDNVLTDPRYFTIPELAATRSEVDVPMIVKGRTVGVLNVQSDQLYAFSQTDVALLQSLANQAGVAIENARLFEEAERRARQLAAINEAGRAIASVLELDAVLREIVDTTKSRFGYYFVGINLMQEDRLIFQRGSTIGDTDRKLDLAGYDLTESASLIAEAARTGEPVLVNDVLADSRYMAVEELPDTRSELNMPIEVKGRVIGVLNVQSDRPNAFDETDVALLQSLANQAGVTIENARLFEETRRRMREVQLLHDVSLAAGAGGGLEETLQAAVEALAVDYQDASVAFMPLDAETNSLHVMTAVGYAEELVDVFRIPVGEGITGWVAQHREPVLAPDVRLDPRYHEAASDIRSELAVPMIVGPQVLGVINLESSQVNAFTNDDLRLLTTLAGNLAVLVERARLTEETQRRARQLAAINEVGRAMSSALDPDVILHQIADGVKARFGYYFVNIALVQGERVALRAASTIGDTDTRPEPGAVGVDLHGIGLVSEAARTGEPVLANDIREDARYAFMPELPDTLSELCVPIRVRDQVIGVLDLESARANDFDEADVTLFQSLAAQAGAALENARLFEETQQALNDTEEQAHRLALLNEMSEHLAQAMGLHEFLDIAAAKTRQIVQTDRVSVAMLTPEGEFDIYALRGEEGAVPTGARISGEGRPIGRAVQERRVIIVPDDRSPDMPEIRSSMVAPLMAGARVLGTLNVGSKRVNAYTQRDSNLLLQIGSLLSAAIENRRLFEETRIRAEELAVLNELAQALTAQLDVDQVLEEAHRGASRLLDTTNFSIGLYDREKDVMNLALQVTESEIDRRLVNVPVSSSVSGYVIRNRTSVLTRENPAEELEAMGVEMVGEPALSWLGVPLLVGDRVLGVMTVQSFATVGLYGEHDRDLLMAIGNQTAIALQNAYLFEETRIRAEELAVLNELAQALTARLKADEVLDETYRGVSRLLDTTNFYIALYNPDEDEVIFAFDCTEGEIRKTYTTRRAGAGLTEYIVRNRRPLLIPANVPETMAELGIEQMGQTAASWLGVPLVIGDRVLGVMAVQSYSTPDLYDEHDRDLLTAIASQTTIALQNARLFEETRSRAEELAVLNELARALTAQLDVDQILEETYRGASRLMGTPNFHVGLYDPEKDEISFPLTVTDSEIDRQIVTISADEGISGYVVRNRTPVLIRENYAEQLEEMGVELLGEPALSWLGVPLMLGNQVLGVMAVQDYSAPRAYDEHDLELMTAVASQTAIALQNARLFEETTSRLAQLTSLQETSRAVASILESDKLLNLITQQAATLLQGDGGIINLVDWENKEEEVVAVSGSQTHALGFRSPLEGSLSGWVSLHNEPVISNQLQDDSRVDPRWRSGEDRGQSAVIAPMTIKDQVIGTLVVMSKQGGKGRFDQADLDLLITFANQAAVALQNARLFEETRSRAEELAALNELARALTAQLNVDQILEETYRGVSRLMEAASFYIGLYDPEKQLIHIALDITEAPMPEKVTTMPSDTGIGGYMIRNRTPVLIRENVAEWQEAMGVEHVGPSGALSWLGVPLMIGDRVLGVMVVQSYTTPRAYDEHDQELLTAIANQVAIALQNARLFEEAQRRATQLAASAEVARDATAILEVELLLNEAVKLISEQFGFYHAGVFLVDEQNEYAILQAASSTGGQRMLERHHRLRVGEVGIVGYVAATGEPRVALDVGADRMHFVNPDLPETRSEMALPLKARERVIGVLDVQSTVEAAFTEDDVAVLQLLADQLATAIANANLFQRVREDANRRALINEVTQAAASSLEIEELLTRAGEAISRQLEMPSVIFAWDTEGLKPISVHDPGGLNVTLAEPAPITAEMDPMMFQAIRTRQLQVLFDVPANVQDAAADLAQRLDLQDAAYIPLISRDQPLGLLELGRHRGHPALDEGELSFLEVVATNLGVALENAHLFREAVETAERLAEVDRLKSQFLANMSHELRTPLNSIIGFSRVILKGIDGPLTEMQRTDLQTVYDSGQHLLKLINDILDLSKVEAGKMELAFEDVQLSEVIKGVMSTAVALVKDKPIELQQLVPEDLPTIYADERRIRQVLLNLVSNAAKFTEEGFIRVEAQATDTDVTLAVTDTGIGIVEDKLDMIFQPFTQVDGSSTRAVGGTGLGLSICRSFVEMHDGHIWVESTAGKGSTFYVTLPIKGPVALEEQAETEETPTPEKAPEEESLEEAGKLVLCVEDDEGVITLFRRYLSKKGYRVVGLTDPTRVVEETRRIHPHAITLDVMMPGKDGWQVIQELKQDDETRHIPVIMCTIVADKRRGLSLGAADYLVKPIIEQELLAALDRLDREAGRHLVLVIDDQADHRALLRRMIEDQDGYEVVEAAGGQEAITMLHRIQPQIIMLDLMMPEMDGFAVLEAVKADENTRSIPIIIVTAKELTDEDRQRLNNNVEALIQKGVLAEDELLEDVAAALKKLAGRLPQAAGES